MPNNHHARWQKDKSRQRFKFKKEVHGRAKKATTTKAKDSSKSGGR